jgi:hypothetical protein
VSTCVAAWSACSVAPDIALLSIDSKYLTTRGQANCSLNLGRLMWVAFHDDKQVGSREGRVASANCALCALQ